MNLYVYDPESMKHVATIMGNSNDTCEATFDERFGDDYGSTYSPAFSFKGGLVRNSDAEEINAHEA